MSFARKSLMLLSASLIAGCVVTTRVVESYDDDCQIVTRHVVLNTGGPAGKLDGCRDTSECIGGLVGLGVVSAASVVISGSVVVVGNAVYWLEKQGKCQKKTVEKA